MKYYLLLLSILSFIAFGQVSYSWWLTEEFVPTSDEALGIQASEYNSNFEKVMIFQCDNNLIFSKKQCSEINKNNAKFSITKDLNSDGKNEIFNVGVAKSLSNDFYHILSIRDSNNRLIQTLTIKSGKPKFSAIHLIGNKIAWARCMLCGDLAYVKYNGQRWFLDWANDYG